MVMLVCIKITIATKSEIPLLCFIVFQKVHCIGLAGRGMRLTIKAGYGIKIFQQERVLLILTDGRGTVSN